MKDTNKLFYVVLFVLALIVNFSGLNVRFFTDDPGLYASVAKNIVYKKDFFQLVTYNLDWLDKPHFPFWIIALSFKLFGISVWAYRLPALLFFLASVGYTFLFTRKYYNQEIAAIAVLILMTAQHILLSNTDVRAEPYLMALLVGSIYHISRLRERFSFTQLLLAAVLTACAVMTKGIFVIIPIYGALLGELVFRKKLSHIFQLRWLWLLLLTFIFTLPEFYALYLQFDLHPEKTVFGRQQVSGIRWFLWDSQFGRFVNNGPISRKASGSIFFYLHTLLWAFAPWCLLFYYAVFSDIRSLFNQQKRAEYYSLCGGLILLLLFSLSRFQLPFYTNAVFPLFAIITAPICYKELSKFGSQFRLVAQWLFVILLPVTIITINFFLKPVNSIFFAVDCVLFGVIALLIRSRIKIAHLRVFFLNCTAALFAGFYLNTVFYNEITPYTGQIAAAEYINQEPFGKFHLYTLTAGNNAYQFYCKRPVDLAPIDDFNSFRSTGVPVFYANQQSLDHLRQSHANFKVVKVFINYPQENILPAFINKATRYKVLDHVYLITK
ncbi:MAG TPA: glycosyltransferase family 39 protein [Mucilaginibacter sp.]|jgi:4-amino-4-deoxy-L-arabinose transferase-like glycosyltransferase|nr:glycosyltransferase family 39 protein [Mucilaginibacter sp.]